MMLRIILVEGRLHPLDFGDYGWVTGVVLCFAVQLWLLGSKAKQLLQRSVAPLAASAGAAVGLVLWARVPSPQAYVIWAAGVCLCTGLLSLNQGGVAPRALAVLSLSVLGIGVVVSRELPFSDLLLLLGVNEVAATVFSKRARRTKLAFGVAPGFREYELRLMRYVAVGEVVKGVVERHGFARVLDVGSGRGLLKLFLPPEAEMHGLDFNADRVERSRAAGYTAIQHDLETGLLPFPNETFDVVVFCHSLEHVRKFDEVVREAARITKPGGRIDIGVPTKVRWLHGIAAAYFGRRNQGHGDTVNFFTAKGVTTRLAGVLPDFAVEELRGFRFLSARKILPLENWRWYWRLSTWWGRKIPHLCPEVNIVLRKPVRC